MLLFCGLMSLATFAHNITIKGHVVSENGTNVEYASVYVDSIYTVSDKNGNFSLTIPESMKADLVVNHISYKPYSLSSSLYHKNGNLTITLEEKVNDLADVSVVAGKKLKQIFSNGMRLPGDVSFRNVKNQDCELGPFFVPNKDYFVGSAKLRVRKSTYSYCTVRLIIYEVKGKEFVPVQHRPLYLRLSSISDKQDCVFTPEESIKLLSSHKYYLGISVMSTNGVGEIHFPAYMHKGCARNLCSGKTKDLPASMGVTLLGVPVRK